jgi:hypothetical protein
MKSTSEISNRLRSVQDEKNYTSGRISDLARNVGFGVLAVIFALLTSKSILGEQMAMSLRAWTLACASFGIATIFLEYFQYFFGYLACRKAAESKELEYRYDRTAFVYKARTLCFWLKQVTAGIAGIVLIVLVWKGIG